MTPVIVIASGRDPLTVTSIRLRFLIASKGIPQLPWQDGFVEYLATHASLQGTTWKDLVLTENPSMEDGTDCPALAASIALRSTAASLDCTAPLRRRPVAPEVMESAATAMIARITAARITSTSAAPSWPGSTP